MTSIIVGLVLFAVGLTGVGHTKDTNRRIGFLMLLIIGLFMLNEAENDFEHERTDAAIHAICAALPDCVQEEPR